jgi:hypothetical protein
MYPSDPQSSSSFSSFVPEICFLSDLHPICAVCVVHCLSLCFPISRCPILCVPLRAPCNGFAVKMFDVSTLRFPDLDQSHSAFISGKVLCHHACSRHIPGRQLDRVRKLSNLPVGQLALQYRSLQPPDRHLYAVSVFQWP